MMPSPQWKIKDRGELKRIPIPYSNHYKTNHYKISNHYKIRIYGTRAWAHEKERVKENALGRSYVAAPSALFSKIQVY